MRFTSWLISHPHSVHMERICLFWSGIGITKYNLTDVEIPQSLPPGDLFLLWAFLLYPPPKSPFLICFMKPQFPCPTFHTPPWKVRKKDSNTRIETHGLQFTLSLRSGHPLRTGHGERKARWWMPWVLREGDGLFASCLAQNHSPSCTWLQTSPGQHGTEAQAADWHGC